MKHIIIYSLLVSTLSSFAQENTKPQFLYCEIIATQRYMNPDKVSIELDMGQERSYWKNNKLRDEVTGKIKSFNSRMDAVNYLSEQGWEMVSTFVASSGNQYTYHYVMRRKAED